MHKTLLTLKDLSEYLQIREEKIIELVEGKVISAYKIGGELLRFRKEQIDAIRSEILSRVSEKDRLTFNVNVPRKETKQKLEVIGKGSGNATFRDRFKDFLYFNDFYIAAAALILFLLVLIFQG